MARKSTSGLSGIANTIARSGTQGTGKSRTSAPALGALRGSLAAIREIDPALIDDWGPADRLDEFTAVNSDDDPETFEGLKRSIAEGGQQVPILVRQSKTEGRFEVIYGRRRLQACRELGLKVRANVQDLDDATALLAKGLENAARRDLSFYEKARFAEAIQKAGHDTDTVRQVLNLSAPGLSHLTKVTQAVPMAVGDLIGSAPKSGRPRWTALAEIFTARRMTEPRAVKLLERHRDLPSDERLDRLLAEAAKRGAQQKTGVSEVTPMEGVSIKSGRGAVSVSVKRSGATEAFADWLDENLEDIIQRSHAEFTQMNPPDDT
ncbi:plasmid partitioning protein RepB [Gymnodinialimonas sp. 2305UL16-5]|uniref:plasmid partitioning protein RepB n=1 Tax=Gymnodinialimonas mytili TaxID=3126503 RepID=UPI00309D7CDC